MSTALQTQKTEETTPSGPADNEALNALAQENAILRAENQNLKQSLDQLQKAHIGKGQDIDVAALSAQIQATIEKTYEDSVNKLKAELDTVKKRLQDKETKELRTRLIEEAGGENALIPAIVTGNTEEELKASIARSKALYEETRNRILKTTTPPSVPNVTVPPAVSTPPVSAAQQAGPLPSLPPTPQTVDQMVSENPITAPRLVTPETFNAREYQKTRAQRLQQLEGKYNSRQF